MSRPAQVIVQRFRVAAKRADAVHAAETQPQGDNGRLERIVDERQNAVAARKRKLVLEGKGRLSRLRVVLRCGDARHNIPQACQRFIRGLTDGTLRSQMLQRAPHLQNRAYLILAQHAAPDTP